MRAPRLRWLALPLLWLLPPGAALAKDADTRCGMYPAGVDDTIYGGFSACRLRDAGEKPLWKGLDPRYRQQIRLAYTNGQAPGFRVIDFVELPDGTGRIGLIAAKWKPGDDPELSIERSYRVSAADVATINRLGEQSGTWNFAIGSWDGDELYVDCDTLDLERVDAAGYRYASINIGCNRPEKLMPLLEFMVALVRLERADAGML